MSRSSARRGQVEPLAALAAVFVVGTAVALYAVGVEEALPGEADRDLAGTTLDAANADLGDVGVVDPGSLDDLRGVAPEGYHLRVVLTTDRDRWTAGPDPPESARTAARPVSVRLWPGRVVAGRLRVEVWP
jgi:hypothetical protein